MATRSTVLFGGICRPAKMIQVDKREIDLISGDQTGFVVFSSTTKILLRRASTPFRFPTTAASRGIGRRCPPPPPQRWFGKIISGCIVESLLRIGAHPRQPKIPEQSLRSVSFLFFLSKMCSIRVQDCVLKDKTTRPQRQ